MGMKARDEKSMLLEHKCEEERSKGRDRMVGGTMSRGGLNVKKLGLNFLEMGNY